MWVFLSVHICAAIITCWPPSSMTMLVVLTHEESSSHYINTFLTLETQTEMEEGSSFTGAYGQTRDSSLTNCTFTLSIWPFKVGFWLKNWECFVLLGHHYGASSNYPGSSSMAAVILAEGLVVTSRIESSCCVSFSINSTFWPPWTCALL